MVVKYFTELFAGFEKFSITVIKYSCCRTPTCIACEDTLFVSSRPPVLAQKLLCKTDCLNIGLNARSRRRRNPFQA
ncbi:hypothetical protein, partial [Corynebacterium sp. HMSC08D02]|uniref:hypothetical protein n=1 Tax=Corynebacterium sp. HMSC08D02 TaxID=1581138 RepID=UPI001AEFFB88